jgi:immunity protein Imm1 of predicted polymorphic toxin system
MQAVWCDRDQEHSARVATWEDVCSVLKSIERRGDPAMLLLFDNKLGTELGVGLGRSMTIFTYQDSLDPPYFVSLGDPCAEGTDSDWSYCGGEQTEYLAQNLVSANLIAPTIQAFLRSLSRPETVAWEQL